MHISEEKPESKEQLKKMRLLIPKVVLSGLHIDFFGMYIIQITWAFSGTSAEKGRGMWILCSLLHKPILSVCSQGFRHF